MSFEEVIWGHYDYEDRCIHKSSMKFLKEDLNSTFKELLNRLYSECEHGDDEHRQWLKDKFDNFYESIKQ